MTAPTLTPQTATACRVPKMGKLFLLHAVMRKATRVAKGLARALSASLASLLGSKDARFCPAQRQRLREKPG